MTPPRCEIGRTGGGQTALDLGKAGQGIFQAQAMVARNQYHTDFIGGDGRDVKLASIAPMDLHVAAPRGHGIVPAEPEAAALVVAGIEAGPAAHGRLAAIGAGDPAGAHQAIVGKHTFWSDAGNAHAPGQANAGVAGFIHHQLMERGAAQAESVSVGEMRFHGGIAVAKTDAAKRMTLGGLQIETQ